MPRISRSPGSRIGLYSDDLLRIQLLGLICLPLESIRESYTWLIRGCKVYNLGISNNNWQKRAKTRKKKERGHLLSFLFGRCIYISGYFGYYSTVYCISLHISSLINERMILLKFDISSGQRLRFETMATETGILISTWEDLCATICWSSCTHRRVHWTGERASAIKYRHVLSV